MGSSARTNVILAGIRIRVLRRAVLLLIVIKIAIIFVSDLLAGRITVCIFKARRPTDVSCVYRQVVFMHLTIFFFSLLHLDFKFIWVFHRVASHCVWVTKNFFLLIRTSLHLHH